MTGCGVERNLSIAREYFEKGAKSGHSSSQFNLCLMYYGWGDVVDVDIKNAIYWGEKSAEQGNVEAIRWLVSLYLNNKCLGDGTIEKWNTTKENLKKAEY